MARQIKIALNNSAGELDSRIVGSEEETKAALFDILKDTPYLDDGDTITVTEIGED